MGLSEQSKRHCSFATSRAGTYQNGSPQPLLAFFRACRLLYLGMHRDDRSDRCRKTTS